MIKTKKKKTQEDQVTYPLTSHFSFCSDKNLNNAVSVQDSSNEVGSTEETVSEKHAGAREGRRKFHRTLSSIVQRFSNRNGQTLTSDHTSFRTALTRLSRTGDQEDPEDTVDPEELELEDPEESENPDEPQEGDLPPIPRKESETYVVAVTPPPSEHGEETSEHEKKVTHLRKLPAPSTAPKTLAASSTRQPVANQRARAIPAQEKRSKEREKKVKKRSRDSSSSSGYDVTSSSSAYYSSSDSDRKTRKKRNKKKKSKRPSSSKALIAALGPDAIKAKLNPTSRARRALDEFSINWDEEKITNKKLLASVPSYNLPHNDLKVPGIVTDSVKSMRDGQAVYKNVYNKLMQVHGWITEPLHAIAKVMENLSTPPVGLSAEENLRLLESVGFSLSLLKYSVRRSAYKHAFSALDPKTSEAIIELLLHNPGRSDDWYADKIDSIEERQEKQIKREKKKKRPFPSSTRGGRGGHSEPRAAQGEYRTYGGPTSSYGATSSYAATKSYPASKNSGRGRFSNKRGNLSGKK